MHSVSAMFINVLFVSLTVYHGFCIPAKPFAQQDNVKHMNFDFSYPDDLRAYNPSPSNGHHHHNAHHHDPAFHDYWDHHHHHHSSDDFNDSGPRKISSTSNSDTMQIPLEIIQQFNQNNITDLLLDFEEDEAQNLSSSSIQNRFGADKDGEERNAAVMPKLARCEPELQTVKLTPTDDLSTFYYPSCTRIERCGGCCQHALLSCQPIETETLSFKLIKSKYKGGKKLSVIEKEVVQVEKHTKCKCDCRVKAGDCSLNQEYLKSECRCVCKNLDEEKKCLKNNQTKLWDPNQCACLCREVRQCSTGTQFDPTECKCKLTPMRRRFAEYTKGNQADPPPASPFDSD